ncbi:DUF4123 domain-containing protein [Billgrantia diversa]|uniref:DUF4123 domain-containing protein n=1 Tax=Halomonas sp. MCCC 1A13316 TaxID=2733487 RepID=UPI0018A4457F|nr:DUF4123 domain-containing protein [Halomonas sp. MCCC 1A13316]QOR39129.1 DUF4123 domain-containing protein [Halomonas sp. MCCC 1A13316]
MNGDLIPDAWREAALPSGIRRYAVIEMATLVPAARTELFDSFGSDSPFWALIDDDTQPHLKREGPWLLEVSDACLSSWQHLDSLSCALHAWIESRLEGQLLAAQLAHAMVVENQSGNRSLLRFYMAELIERLHAEAPEECREALFGGIERWWYRANGNEWVALPGLEQRKPSGNWHLKVDDDLWAALHGDTEVMGLTAVLVESAPDLFLHVCNCERPRLVARALEGADRRGLLRGSDRRTYVYLQLSQGEEAWQSEEMQVLLQQASLGEKTLLELLEAKYGEADAR